MDNARKVKLFGDRIEAMRKYGEGQALLRATKSIAELLGIPYYRLFNADKTVMAQSITGMQDQIILSHEPEVPIEEEKKPYCNIAFLNLPETIPPMKWYTPGLETFTKVDGTWIIKNPNGVVEVEGVDYIKTYYSASTKDCPGCTPLAFTVAEGADANILTGSSPNRPFWYKAENDDGSLIYNYEGAMVPHHMGYDWTHPPIPPNPLNHTIYSLWGCQAQIIKFGHDEQGSYFLWKAYTEWSNVGPEVVTFSRTGLGYMLMQAFIKNGGINLCESEGTIIKVDCCLKPADERKVILWWESLGPYEKGGPTCTFQPFMFYGSIKICEVPSEVAGWYALLCTGPGPGEKGFFVIPQIQGGCLPFTWTIDNNLFVITPSVPNGEMAGLTVADTSCGSADCNTEVTVTVKDRCETENKVRFISCCEQAANIGNFPTIGYTSLSMHCNGKQTLTVSGGCAPVFTWSLSGDGSLNPTTGTTVEYTAPTTNANCSSNPTITVTDCCGNSGQVSLAVNCYTLGGTALKVDDVIMFCCYELVNPDCAGLQYDSRSCYRNRTWDCDGSLILDTGIWGSWYCPSGAGVCPAPRPCENNCACNEQSNQVCIDHINPLSGITQDNRTPAMKAAACCPLNPLTGLPY